MTDDLVTMAGGHRSSGSWKLPVREESVESPGSWFWEVGYRSGDNFG